MAGIDTGDIPFKQLSSKLLDVFRPAAHTARTPEPHGMKTAEYIRDLLICCLQGVIYLVNDRNNTCMAATVEQNQIIFTLKYETLLVAEIIRTETVF